jgi:catechol 2,3-dioxygenase-like lactoylglutathione lyase family enzyme
MTLERVTNAIRVKRISHVAIAVRDLERQADFYINMCGLQPVEHASQHLYLRASGSHHHVFQLLKGGGGLDHVSFQLDDDEDIQR